MQRREFIKTTIAGGVSALTIPSLQPASHFSSRLPFAGFGECDYSLTLDVPVHRYDGKQCWVHPRAGIVPDLGKRDLPRVVMVMNTLDVSGSDVFRAVDTLHTDDLGTSWTAPQTSANLALRTETIAGVERPVALSDFTPAWHSTTRKLLGTGHSVAYTPEWKVKRPRPRHTTYSAYDATSGKWALWKKLELPGDKFNDAGSGSVQRVDRPDGKILLPIYFSPAGKNSRVTVSLCSFDGDHLKYIEHGNEIIVDDDTRGIHEPSLTYFDGEYFIAIRHNLRGYVARSKDGLNFEPLTTWQFDDGKELGTYNTQQHWVTHSDGLFLVYTRRGANNDHVFRNRAPLFMARFDPKTLRVIRETERILVPERGARLGNFGVCNVSPNETWVTVAEWMQKNRPDRIIPVNNPLGADGSVYVARIHWKNPNRSFSV